MRFTPTATTPARKESGPESCMAAAPVFKVEEVSAFTVTSAALLPPFLSMLVSFSPAVMVLLILASAPMPCAANFALFTRPTPTATVVALELSVAVALMTGVLSPAFTVVMSALLISARTVSFPSPASEPLSLSVKATPTPKATVVSLMASSPDPAMVVLLVLSVAFTVTEEALVILSFVAQFLLSCAGLVSQWLPSLSSPMTATVSLWPRLMPKLPWAATVPPSL